MKKLVYCILATLTLISCERMLDPTSSQALGTKADGSALVSGSFISAGYNNGMSVFSIDWSTSNSLYGFVPTSAAMPDMVIVSTSGVKTGPYYVEFRGFDTDGSPIYGSPIAISKYPWTKDQVNIIVKKIGGKIYGFDISNTGVNVALWDASSKSFGTEWLAQTTHAKFPLTLVRSELFPNPDGRTATVLLLLYGVKETKPPVTTEDEQVLSWYYSNGAYKGTLPYGTVYKATMDLETWVLDGSSIERVTEENEVIIGPRSIMPISSENGSLKGATLFNKMGAMKYVDFINTKGADYIKDTQGNVITNPSAINRGVNLPGSNSFITSGEGRNYYYEFDSFDASGAPVYHPAKILMSRGRKLYSGSLTCPSNVDWDGDGVLDIIAGTSEGRILFFKNYGTDAKPAFDEGRAMHYADGVEICERAGFYELQGPMEGCWGYICPNVVDWNDDGLLDIVYSFNEGKFCVMLNIGSAKEPLLAHPKELYVDGEELYGSWRQRPGIFKHGGETFIALFDTDATLHLYKKSSTYMVEDCGIIPLKDGALIRDWHSTIPSERNLGVLGRERLEFVDWDQDGDLDLLVGTSRMSNIPYDSEGRGLPYSAFQRGTLQVMYFQNVGTTAKMVFDYPRLATLRGAQINLGAHEVGPCASWMGSTASGPNLIIGCESGAFYFMNHDDVTWITTFWK